MPLQGRSRSPTTLTSICREKLERAMGFEPTTPTLARLCSTPELRPHPVCRAGRLPATRWDMHQSGPDCNGQRAAKCASVHIFFCCRLRNSRGPRPCMHRQSIEQTALFARFRNAPGERGGGGAGSRRRATMNNAVSPIARAVNATHLPAASGRPTAKRDKEADHEPIAMCRSTPATISGPRGPTAVASPDDPREPCSGDTGTGRRMWPR